MRSARAVPGRDGQAVRARDGRDRGARTRASASRRSFIAAPSGSTRSSRRRRSPPRRARRSRSERSLDEALAVLTAALERAGARVSDAVPYEHLTPDVIIDAVESCGFECTGSILGLASYENRVYQIGVADGFVVAKFYRPGRWSTDAILEEHDFALELAEQDIPVVAPLVHDGEFAARARRLSLCRVRAARRPLARARHERGSRVARPVLGPDPCRRRHAAVRRSGRRSIARRWARARRSRCSTAIGCRRISSTSYERVTEQLVDAVEQCFDEVGDYRELRIHGDCHRNNVLWTDDGPHFVDLDDCMNGPAVQDLWLFLAGSRDEMAAQLGDLLEGYGKFADFDYRELELIEALRALRLDSLHGVDHAPLGRPRVPARVPVARRGALLGGARAGAARAARGARRASRSRCSFRRPGRPLIRCTRSTPMFPRAYRVVPTPAALRVVQNPSREGLRSAVLRGAAGCRAIRSAVPSR